MERIDNIEKIDIIIPEDENGNFVMIITDDHDWINISEHTGFIIKKINYYLLCLNSNDLYIQFENAKNLKKMIKIIFKFEISSEIIDFLEKTKISLNNKQYLFEYEKYEIKN